MDLDYLKLIFEVIIAGSTACGVLYAGWRMVRKRVSPYLAGLAALPDICQSMPAPSHLRAMEATLASIAKEARAKTLEISLSTPTADGFLA